MINNLQFKPIYISQAQVVNLTWASRCDKVMFVTDQEDPSLPTMVVKDMDGRDKLWGKTKKMFVKAAVNNTFEFDWILKVGLGNQILTAALST